MSKNPIDADKVAEQPGLMEYAHHVGSALIQPLDKSKIKAKALVSMQHQAEQQMSQLKKQLDLILSQAKELQERVEISKLIYQCQMNFEPVVGENYYLYQKEDESFMLSLIAPEQWGKNKSFKAHIASLKLLGDHTWQVLEGNLKDVKW